ncbi:MAG: DegV family protein [Candidatus Paceibacterota bacterium]
METENQNKKLIGIVADEAVDLPDSIVQENEISLVKFKLDFEELKDVPGNVYEKMREGERRGLKTIAKTSQPSINDFLGAYREKLKRFEEIICFTISGKLSGTFNSALQATKFLPKEAQDKIHLVDTLNATGGEGLVALWAADMIKEAKLKAGEIAETIRKNVSNFKLIGIYGTPKWLEASGRLPKFLPAPLRQAEKMNLKPIFALKNGKITFISIRKNLNGIANTLFQEFEKQTLAARNQGKKIRAAITHGDNPAGAEELKNLVSSLENVKVEFISLACFPIGGHVGPESLVLSWQQ